MCLDVVAQIFSLNRAPANGGAILGFVLVTSVDVKRA